jgi:hypothetical protein
MGGSSPAPAGSIGPFAGHKVNELAGLARLPRSAAGEGCRHRTMAVR